MSRSRIVALSAIDALLVCALLLGLFAQRSVSDDRPLTRVQLLPADRVVIDAQSVISIARAEGGWDLLVDDGRYPARYDRIEPFVDEVESGRVVREVTDDPALHEDFGVTEALARRVVIETGPGAVELLFGTSGDRADSIYVREPGEDSVVLARAAVDFYLRQPASFWAYLRVFPEDVVAATIVRVGLRTGPGAIAIIGDPGYTGLELVRDPEERWVLSTDAGAAEAAQLEGDRLARNLADLVGDGFYEGPVAGFIPVAGLAFSASDGREFSADILTDGNIMIVDPAGPGLPGSRYGGLRYTLAPEKLARLVPRATALIGESR